MKHTIKSKIGAGVLTLSTLVALPGFLTSCDMVNEELDPCPRGISVRFIYDYNMERANAFHSQVDCVTLYVFNEEGKLLEKHTETSPDLRDESYRMYLDLEPGNYSFLALGGSSCEKNSFRITDIQTRDHYEEMSMQLPLDPYRTSDAKLHDLFFGSTEMVTLKQYEMKELNVYMIKDTNSVQVTLQEIDAPYTVDVADYEFLIEADNELLGHDNVTVSTGGMLYNPHEVENRVAGFVDVSGSGLTTDDSQKVQVAVSEFNLSRLMTQDSEKSYIVVKAKDSGAEIIRVPLIEYMLLSKHSGHSWIQTNQEYLDRQSTWNFMFFLQRGKWLQTKVAVNNWIVRFNHAEV